jgi:hypothetical protein
MPNFMIVPYLAGPPDGSATSQTSRKVYEGCRKGQCASVRQAQQVKIYMPAECAGRPDGTRVSNSEKISLKLSADD